jgi:hypothetical protein
LPVENIEIGKKYPNDPGIQSALSGLLNNENALVAKQAADVISTIPNNVGAEEYLNVANALTQSSINDRALKLYKAGLLASVDVNDEVNILRG